MEQQKLQLVTNLPPMAEDATWRTIDPRDCHRIACDSVGACGQDAVWATRQDGVYVCDYHRFLLEVQRALETLSPSRNEVAA